MTLKEVYQEGKKTLTEAELESPAFDAISLFHKVFGMDRQALAIHGAADAGEVRLERYRALIRERAAGRPLQYILGSWPFMDLELEVGEGVLIPREETELLVYTGARRLAQAFPCMAGGKGLRAADLCAGTGAVALGLAGLLPQASVAALELEEEAFVYLQRNCRRMGRRVQPLRCDICRPSTAEQFGGLHGHPLQPAVYPLGGAARFTAGSPPRTAERIGWRDGWPPFLPLHCSAVGSPSGKGRRVRGRNRRGSGSCGCGAV